MTIGASLLLIAVGAILRFAVQTVSTHGINLHTIGDILMIIGIVGLLLWLFLWGPWARGRRSPRRVPQPSRDARCDHDPQDKIRRLRDRDLTRTAAAETPVDDLPTGQSSISPSSRPLQ